MLAHTFAFLLCLSLCGCTSISEYVHNGFKVGPNYKEPPAPVAQKWIDADDKRFSSALDDHEQWWQNFNDPTLDKLICDAYEQNLTLKEAGMRILQARATLGISIGELFPQTQQALGDYTRTVFSKNTTNAQFLANRYSTQFDFGFGISWELDFWGRFRRAVESADANLQASVYDYDDVLVTLLGDVATAYVNLRVAEKRIKYARKNVELQEKTVKILRARQKVKADTNVPLAQALGLLYQTEATIPELEITARVSANQLCILMGIPPEDLRYRLDKGWANIPKAPAPEKVAVGVPADLLRRRPDVRRAERQAAVQSALIGVAVSDLYPHFYINGDILRSASHFNTLFDPQSYSGVIGPSFQWDILNYGRHLNNIKFQDARFRELVFAYQQTVLNAEQDVETGLVTFLKGEERRKKQFDSVSAVEGAAQLVGKQFDAGAVNEATLILFLQNLVVQQDTLAIAEGETVLGLIQTYRALGGGWQIRENGCPAPQLEAPAPVVAPPVLPKLPPPAAEKRAMLGPPI
jgi:NodT family efflux transporter outer membrane factor (OMF) lipoprotein